MITEIGTNTFKLRVYEREGVGDKIAELTIGQYSPVLFDAEKLDELYGMMEICRKTLNKEFMCGY